MYTYIHIYIYTYIYTHIYICLPVQVLQLALLQYNFNSEDTSEISTDEANSLKTLNSLNAMRMKFPGKCELETEYILDKVVH